MGSRCSKQFNVEDIRGIELYVPVKCAFFSRATTNLHALRK